MYSFISDSGMSVLYKLLKEFSISSYFIRIDFSFVSLDDTEKTKM